MAGIFLVGAVASFLSVAAAKLQNTYYLVTRDRMTALAGTLGLGDASVAPTPGSRGQRLTFTHRAGRVRNVLYGLFGILGLVDVAGLLYALLF